jgi:hypothetical protein
MGWEWLIGLAVVIGVVLLWVVVLPRVGVST